MFFDCLLRQIERLVRPAEVTNVVRVLVVDLNFIGDVVMASPIARAIRETTHARVDVLGLRSSAEALEANPYYDRVHLVGGWIGVLCLLPKLRWRYDAVVNTTTSLRTNFLMFLMAARIRVGYNYRHRGCFNSVRVPIDTRTMRMGNRVEECLALVDWAFGIAESRGMVFAVNPLGEGLAHDVLRQTQRPLVVIHAVANGPERWWKQERFAVLARRIVNSGKVVVFTGESKEGDGQYIDGIIYLVGRFAYNFAGRTTLAELAALMREARLVVTLNSGPLHIARAVGARVFALIGGTPASVVFPEGDYVEDPGLIAYDPQTGTYTPRMEDITVEEVWQRIQKYL